MHCKELREGLNAKTYKFVSELVKIRDRLKFYFCLNVPACGYMSGCHLCVYRGQKRVLDPLWLQ